MRFDFEKLNVYQKALDFTDEVYKVSRSFPREEQFGITSQLRRASLSIPLNIAESCGRRQKNDRRHFLDMARGSVHECIPLIEMCCRQRYVDNILKDKLYENCSELSRMICGLINSLK